MIPCTLGPTDSPTWKIILSSVALPFSSESTTSRTGVRASAGEGRAVRDTRLDFWRGLCLIDMVLVHLVYQGIQFGEGLQGLLGEYTRFAAGGYIFVAGLGIGLLYLPKVHDPLRRWKTYTSLWKRSIYVLLVHYAAEISFLLLYPLSGSGGFTSVASEILAIFTFRKGCDLLPFYVMVLAVAPLLLELLRRRLGWVVLAGSAALFVLAQRDPYVLTFPIQTTFLPGLWQLPFVLGMLAGALLPRYDRLSLSSKRRITGVVAIVSVCIWLDIYAADFGWVVNSPFLYWKIPLTVGELLRYLSFMGSIILLTNFLWPRITRLPGMSAVQLLGRRSLAVYVFHLWVVQILVRLSTGLGMHGWVNLICIPVALLTLWGWARWMDYLATSKVNPARTQERYWTPIGVSVVACLLLLMVNPLVRFVDADPPPMDQSFDASALPPYRATLLPPVLLTTPTGADDEASDGLQSVDLPDAVEGIPA